MASRANQRSVPREQNYTMLQAFEWYLPEGGKHWNLFKEKVDKLADMGITAAWLPPPTKGSSPADVGYGIKDIWDLGEFDQGGGVATKYGTKEQLVAAVKYAKKKGIVTYIDAVLNHKLGADGTELFKVIEVDQDDRQKELGEPFDIEGWTSFKFEPRNGQYSKMQWNFNHFTGVDYDNKTGKKGIFKIQGENKDWATHVDQEKGSYDYLMGADIDHDHPEAREDLKNWGVWILKELGAEGFRFDAIKHIDEKFIAEFVKHVRAETGNDDLFAVGEFWKDSIDDINGYLTRFDAQFSVFDAPLHYNFKEASDAGRDYDIRKIFDGTLVQNRPIDAVTLVDNHDTQPYQALESWVGPQFKPLAYSIILLRPDGYPCVFWGDLFGCGGPEGKTFEPVSQLENFIKARKWFAYGVQRDYWDHAQCAGWVRTGDAVHDGCAVILSIGDEGSKRMEVGSEHAGEVWTDVLGWHQDEITIGEDGWAEFKCPGSSVSIWAKKDAKGRDNFGKQE